MFKRAIVAAIVLFVLATAVQVFAGGRPQGHAQGPGMEGGPGPMPPPPPPPIPLGIWQDQRAVKELGLSGKQVGALKDLDDRFKKDMRRAVEEAERTAFELEKAFAQERFDERLVRDLAAKVPEVQGRIFNLHLDARIGLHQTLTAEQLKILRLLPPPHPPAQGPGQGQGAPPAPGR